MSDIGRCLDDLLRSNKKNESKKIAIILMSAIIGALFVSNILIYGSQYNNGYNNGNDDGFDDGYNDGYLDGNESGYNNGLSDKVTVYLNILDNTVINWHWNDTYLNASQDVNRAVSMQLIPYTAILSIKETFRLVADWFDNETGESYWNSEEDNNLPQLNFECLQYTDICIKNIPIACRNVTSVNFTMYDEQIQDYIFSAIGYSYENETGLEPYFETNDGNDADNKSAMTFPLPLFNDDGLFAQLIIPIIIMIESMNPVVENQTIVDYINDTFYSAWDEAFAPYVIDVEPNSEYTVNFGNLVINQKENEFGQGDYLTYDSFMMNMNVNMNGTNYVWYSNGTTYIL